MFEYKVTSAQDKDIDILTSIKLVTMIDDDMDKKLSSADKNKVKKTIQQEIDRICEQYKMIYVGKMVAGAYLTTLYDDGVMIDEIYLFPEYRNKKIGTRIINDLKNEYDLLYIWVYKNNVDAIRLFEKLGFVTIQSGRTQIMKYDVATENLKDKLDNIRLGYRDKNGIFYSDYTDDFKENYYLQNPKQLLESKVGLCFDQVELGREILNKLDIASRAYFICYPDDEYDMAHSILVYKDNKRYYWYESAWSKYKGIHIYDNKEELLDDVLHKFVDTVPNGDFKKVKCFSYEKPRFGSNYVRLISFCIGDRSIKIK